MAPVTGRRTENLAALHAIDRRRPRPRANPCEVYFTFVRSAHASTRANHPRPPSSEPTEEFATAATGRRRTPSGRPGARPHGGRSCGCLSELRRRSPWPAGWRLRRPLWRRTPSSQASGCPKTATPAPGSSVRTSSSWTTRTPAGRGCAAARGARRDAARSWACRSGILTPSRPRARAARSSTSVRAGSAAEKAGIKKGDVITEFDGERVRGVRHLTRLVTETPDGRTVKAAVHARRQAGGLVGHSRTAAAWPAWTATSSVGAADAFREVAATRAI